MTYRNNKNSSTKKYIYNEDELYAGQGANGWYLYHTTKDPENKFKQVRIGDLAEEPERKFRLEKIRYGQNNEKVKHLLDKNNDDLKDWIESEYPNFVFTNDSSPWAPKKMGEKTTPKKRDTTDSDDDIPTATQQPTKTRIQELDVKGEIKEKLDNIYTLLLEIRRNQVVQNTQQGAEPGSD